MSEKVVQVQRLKSNVRPASELWWKMNQTFQALLKEAQFTKEILGSGATQIRRANYATKGIYFQAFTSLSTGLERIGKLCLMLDHYIETKGSFPDFKFMKNEIGHNLLLLEAKASDVVSRRGLGVEKPNSPIHAAIVKVLSEYAEGDRYSNVNILVGSNRSSDPVSAWYSEVDIPLFESAVKPAKKQKIAQNAKLISDLTSSFMHIQHTSETGGQISDVEDASFRTGVFEAVSPLRQLYVLQIIRFWASLLSELQRPAQAVGKQEIPFFGELFAEFRNEDSYLRTRKVWES